MIFTWFCICFGFKKGQAGERRKQEEGKQDSHYKCHGLLGRLGTWAAAPPTVPGFLLGVPCPGAPEADPIGGDHFLFLTKRRCPAGGQSHSGPRPTPGPESPGTSVPQWDAHTNTPSLRALDFLSCPNTQAPLTSDGHVPDAWEISPDNKPEYFPSSLL